LCAWTKNPQGFEELSRAQSGAHPNEGFYNGFGNRPKVAQRFVDRLQNNEAEHQYRRCDGTHVGF
jgi:hypothetical protein